MPFSPEERASLNKRIEQLDAQSNANLSLGKIATELQKADYDEEVEEIVTKFGERPHEIFSGGVVSDVFDALNALQYGVAGVAKGIGFAKGVKSRASFSDKDMFGSAGLPGALAGFAMDIITDPLLYMAPISAIGKVGKIAGLGKQATKAVDLFKKSSFGSWAGRKLVYMYGADPQFKKAYERSIIGTEKALGQILDKTRPITELSMDAQQQILKARRAGDLSTLPGPLLEKAKPAFKMLDDLSEEAVVSGLLPKDLVYGIDMAFEAGSKLENRHIRSRIKRLVDAGWDKKKARAEVKRLNKEGGRIKIDGTLHSYAPLLYGKRHGVNMQEWIMKARDRLKRRKNLTPETRKALDEILEAGQPLVQGLVQMRSLIERRKFFGEVASIDKLTGGKLVSDVAEKGYEFLPKSAILGDLSGKFVPKYVKEYLNPMIERSTSQVGKFERMLVGGFKFGKVILNPATHGRNMISNLLLNNFEGLSPARMDVYKEAFGEVSSQGVKYKRAVDAGMNFGGTHSQEIQAILEGPEGALALNALGKIPGGAKKLGRKIARLYQKEEEWAKMAQFIYQTETKGLSPEKAVEIAERATFNYAQVTPFIRNLRSRAFGMPFITFTAKATPQVARTALHAPTRISFMGKAKQAVENQANGQELEKERASEPGYVKDGFYVRLPVKDKFGRPAYFDMTYIVPFGDLITGKLFGADKENQPASTAVLAKFPLLNIIGELYQNKDFYGNKIVKATSTEPEQIGADVMSYLFKSYSPPLLNEAVGLVPGAEPGKIKRSIDFELEKGLEENNIQVDKRTTRTLKQEFMRNLGLKTTPFNIEREREKRGFEIRDRLSDLAVDAGLRKKFTKTFKPKDQKEGKKRKKTLRDLFGLR